MASDAPRKEPATPSSYGTGALASTAAAAASKLGSLVGGQGRTVNPTQEVEASATGTERAVSAEVGLHEVLEAVCQGQEVCHQSMVGQLSVLVHSSCPALHWGSAAGVISRSSNFELLHADAGC